MPLSLYTSNKRSSNFELKLDGVGRWSYLNILAVQRANCRDRPRPCYYGTWWPILLGPLRHQLKEHCGRITGCIKSWFWDEFNFSFLCSHWNRWTAIKAAEKCLNQNYLGFDSNIFLHEQFNMRPPPQNFYTLQADVIFLQVWFLEICKAFKTHR